jgi:uncharacterized protein YqgV (UPF0045/DUF77 family)
MQIEPTIMKVQIPEQLKSDVPHTQWGKILTATPVVMAVIATMLAGLASSEMNKAQYDRALAAQQQSKAGDQWSFFQAKRLRSAIQRNTFDLLQTSGDLHPFDPAALRVAAEQLPAQLASVEAGLAQSAGAGQSEADKQALLAYQNKSAQRQAEAAQVKTGLLTLLDSPAGQRALTMLQEGALPSVPPAAPVAPTIKAAMDAVENSKLESELAPLLTEVTLNSLDETLRAARDQAQAFDTATKPINQTIDQMDALLARRSALLQGRPAVLVTDAGGPRIPLTTARDFTAARLRYAALRYETEARLNQSVADLYELQVRKSNTSAERHHARSQRFFFGMLAAQLAVIVSTFAIAARQRNFLWSIAAAAGLAAIAFAVYVYLCI